MIALSYAELLAVKLWQHFGKIYMAFDNGQILVNNNSGIHDWLKVQDSLGEESFKTTFIYRYRQSLK